MKKAELIAKLEGAKELTSVVSIDLILTALGMLEDEAAKPKGFSLKPAQFDMLMDKIEEATSRLDSRELVDMDTAEFELDYNNCISLRDVDVDTDCIYNAIRENLEELIDDSEDEVEEGEYSDDRGLESEPADDDQISDTE